MSTGSRDPLPGKTEDRAHLTVCEEKKKDLKVCSAYSASLNPGDDGV